MARVLNFGSLNLDFVYSVDHFVRAGETLSSLQREEFCGGKGLNQSVALARAGLKPFHAGVVGLDGKLLLDTLSINGVDTAFVKRTDTTTGHAIIQRDTGGQNCILLYSGANHCVTQAQIDEALAAFSDGDYLVLQNEINNVGVIMKAAKARGMRVAFNPSPINEGIHMLPLELVDIFLLNEVEAGELCRHADKSRMLGDLRSLYPDADIVLTLGKQGVVYSPKGSAEVFTHGIYNVDVVDTTAAGDTFTGYFLAGTILGKPIEETLELASRASSIAVSRAGATASIPTMDEVLNTTLMPC